MTQYKTKLDISNQAELTQLTDSDLLNVDILDNGKTIIYKKTDGSLGLASKDIYGNITKHPVGGDTIKTLTIPALPTTLPTGSTAYVLGVVSNGTGVQLAWTLTNTVNNYNQ